MADIGLMGFGGRGASWKQTLETVKLAEELGYASAWTGEAWGADALTSLAQVAAVTTKLRIGTAIVPTYARSPANLAMAALNLDTMSEGRFTLGLGTSGKAVIEDLHGEKFDRPLERMREYIDIIRKATNGARIDHEGEFFTTKRFRLTLPPFRPNLPIFIASLSPVSLRMTGELADGWLPIYLAPARMKPLLDEIEEGARSAGRSLSDITLSPQVSIYVTDDAGAAYDRERPHIAFYIGGMGVYYHRYMRRIGFAAEADRVREAFLAGDREGAAKLVTDEMVAAMTIIGTANECRDQMEKNFFAHGIHEVRLVFNEPTPEAYVAGLRAVAPG